jgi:aspartyl-tRNA synthetase
MNAAMQHTHQHQRLCLLADDLVLNGLELGGGGIRIHNAELQVIACSATNIVTRDQ